VPWSIEVSEDLASLVDADPLGLRAACGVLREQLFFELGVPLPVPRVKVRADLDERQVVVLFFEVPAAALALPELAEAERLPWLQDRIVELLRSRAADFLGLAEVQRLLDELEQFAPATVRNVVPKPVSLVLLTDVVRRLVEEGISVRDLRGILEILSTIAVTEKDPLNLAEFVRAQMRRPITYRLTGGLGQLDVVLLDPLIEDTVRRAITRTAAGAFLALPPQSARDVLAAVRHAVEPLRHRDPLVILTQPDIRRFVRKLLEPEMPKVCVVSFAELLPEVALKPLARAVPI
jgi:type III secretion protein V